MTTTRGPLARVRRLLAASHPGPTVAVTVLAGILAAALQFSPERLAVVMVAVLAGQLSIGWSNDWLDAARDREVGRSDKPVAQGLVSVAEVRRAALVSVVIAVAVSFALGLGAGLAHTILVASGWAYNVWLKRTPASVVPFLVSFGLLPAVVTLASPEPAAPAWWAVTVGAVFGVAIHFTNVLPDLDDDAATGVVGLPHRLGRRASGLVAFVALAVAASLVAIGQLTDPAGLSPLRIAIALGGAVVTIGIAVLGARRVLTRAPDRGLFRLIIVAGLVVTVQLAFAGTTLVAA
ncbi:UbiA family prenyltransferase [Frigoribacterium sp. 2-23]|uniref:UbiA family prenyltransferase n=1 Tax=Frigoribacterium sp. 2-23 TaxID=3415006 RepID=UPI003C6F94E8